MKHTRLPLFLALSIFAALIALIASIVVNYQLGFYTVTEAEMYIPFFLSGLSLPHRLFYFPITDFYYRARELSTLFNILDTYFLGWSAKLGMPHFLSVVHYLTLTAIAAITVLFSEHSGKKSRLSIVLLLLAFLTSPAVFLTGMYFRPTKILVSLGIFLCVLCMDSLHKKKKVFFGAFGASFILTLCMGLTDELGLVFTVLFGLWCVTIALRSRNRSFHLAALGFFAGNLILLIYRTFIGPMIILHMFHIVPSTWGIQGLDLSNIHNVQRSFSLLILYLQYFAGNTPVSVALILGALTSVVYVILYKGRSFSPKAGTIALSIVAAALAFFTVLYHVLSLRHVVLFWPEYSIIYYPMPLYALLFSILLVLIPPLLERTGKFARMVPVLFAFWFITNITAIPTHIRTLTHPLTKTSVYYGLAHPMLRAIEHPEIPIETLKPEYRNGVETIRKFMKQ